MNLEFFLKNLVIFQLYPLARIFKEAINKRNGFLNSFLDELNDD